MKLTDIALLRLHNQHISRATHKTPADVVGWLGAVQAQDYLGAHWALGLRMKSATEKDIDRALVERSIIRTWPMRGTLHFVRADDAKWMLTLMATRVVKRAAYRAKQLGLDEVLFNRSKELFIKALQGGKQLTRDELYQVLEKGGISTTNYRGLHILGHHAQEALLCFGARQGKQQTFTLFNEWVSNSKEFDKDQALAEITVRYFTSHGPATIQDMMWWSGLTAVEIKAGIASVKSKLTSHMVEGKVYWMSKDMPSIKETHPIYILPAFDEYFVSYKDRAAVLKEAYKQNVNPGSNGMLAPTIVSQGQIIGTWKRMIKKSSVVVTPLPFTKLSNREYEGFEEAAMRYGTFLQAFVTITK
jgi:hypothetical protein